MIDPTTISLDQQIASVKREIAMRKNAYPRFISNGKMRQGEADHEIAAMTAALHSLMKIKEAAP